jgi:hypothetical protein
MKNYTWTVDSLYTKDLDTQSNYVVDVTFTISGEEVVDGQTYSAESRYNALKFEVSESEDFIPYNDLTNDIVIGWIKSSLGPESVASFEASIGGMIDSKITPSVEPSKPALPWS